MPEGPRDGAAMGTAAKHRQRAASRATARTGPNLCPSVVPGAALDPALDTALDTEVLIVGGGLVGLSLAVALADAGIEVLVIDREDPAAQLGQGFDGRSAAIAQGSRQALEGIGLWRHLEAEAEPILDIRVSDGRVGAAASRPALAQTPKR